jgi:hypothetical protein
MKPKTAKTPDLKTSQAHVLKLQDACEKLDEFGEALDHIITVLEASTVQKQRVH